MQGGLRQTRGTHTVVSLLGAAAVRTVGETALWRRAVFTRR